MPNSSVMTSSPLKRKHQNLYQFKTYICWVGHGLLLIMAAIVPPTTDNISTLYNNVVKSEVIREMGCNMRTKRQAQVSRKLVLLQDEQAVVYALRLD
mgnify:CR=1 FL=1